jgi:hypothetical protein
MHFAQKILIFLKLEFFFVTYWIETTHPYINFMKQTISLLLEIPNCEFQ